MTTIGWAALLLASLSTRLEASLSAPLETSLSTALETSLSTALETSLSTALEASLSTALEASLCQDDPAAGEFTMTGGGREHAFPLVVFYLSAETLQIGRGDELGPRFRLSRTPTGWTPTRHATQQITFPDGTTAKVTRLSVQIESEEAGALVGSWSGQLLDDANRATPVRGDFRLVTPESREPKPNLFLGGIGCVVLAVLLVANAGVGLWFIVVAFQESAMWGIAVLLLPFASLAFVVLHWDAAKRPFLWSLGTAVASFGVMAIIAAAAA